MDGEIIGAVAGLSGFPIITVVGIVLLFFRQWGPGLGALFAGTSAPILVSLAIVGVVTQLWHFALGIIILMTICALLFTFLEARFPRQGLSEA